MDDTKEIKSMSNNMIALPVFDGDFNEEGWREQAACRGKETAKFFVEERGRSSLYDDARAVCAACPVRQECLDFAVKHRIVHGMWGGLSYRARLKYSHTITPVRKRNRLYRKEMP